MDRLQQSIDKQVHTIVKEKRGWAFYEKHQPDYQAFETDMKKLIVALLSPTINDNTKIQAKLDEVLQEQFNIDKRMNEMEFVYRKVAMNASAQQDALKDLETRSMALRETDRRLRDQLEQCKDMKQQMEEKFKVLREDRKLIFKRFDHVDDELNNYRTDIRQIHDQIQESFYEKLREIGTRSLQNQISIDAIKQTMQDTITRQELLIHSDFRDQSVIIQSLQENFKEYRRNFIQLDSSIVSRSEWIQKNQALDSQANIIMARNTQLQSDQKNMDNVLKTTLKLDVQSQIDKTMVAIWGGKKKIMKSLRDHQEQFYEKFEKQINVLSEDAKREPIVVSTEGDDSDQSLDRFKQFIKQIDDEGQEDGEGSLVTQLLMEKFNIKREDKQMAKVREIYLQKIPLRRCGLYQEDKNEVFIQSKQSKVRQLSNKLQQYLKQCNQYTHLMISPEKCHTVKIPQKSQRKGFFYLKSQEFSRKSLENLQIHRALSYEQKARKNSILMQPFQPGLTIIKQKSESDYFKMINDPILLINIYNKLPVSRKFTILSALMSKMAEQVKFVPKLQLEVIKIKTAIRAFFKNPILMNEKAESFVKILTAKEIKDNEGKLIDMTKFKENQKKILKKLIQLESSDSCQSTSRQRDEGIQPTKIATESQKRPRRHTVMPQARSAFYRETQSDLTKYNQDQSQDSSAVLSITGTQTTQQQKWLGPLQELKSVQSSEVNEESSSESVKAQQKPTDVQKTQKNQEQLQKQDSKPVSSINQESASKTIILDNQSSQRSSDLIKNKRASSETDFSKKKGQLDNEGVRDTSSFRDDSGNSIQAATDKSNSAVIKDDDFGLLPEEANIPEADGILMKMKHQLDELEVKMQDRTHELREVQKYLKRFETRILEVLTKKFDNVLAKIDHNKLSLEDFIQDRMHLIGNRFIKVNKDMRNLEEKSLMDFAAFKRRIKLFGRQVDQRMDEVNTEHDFILGKYNFLLNCNNYLGDLASTVVKVTELNSRLFVSDENDRRSICLMGSKGPQTLRERTRDVHMHHLQNQMTEIEQTDPERIGQPRTQRRIPSHEQVQYQGSELQKAPKNIKKNMISAAESARQPMTHRQMQSSARPISGISNAGAAADPIIQIDKRCQTCSDDKGQLLHLFKIACLSYFPGMVEYEGKKYTKEALMRQQDVFVKELKVILDRSGVNQDQTNQAECDKMRDMRMKERCEDIGRSTDEDEPATKVIADSPQKKNRMEDIFTPLSSQDTIEKKESSKESARVTLAKDEVTTYPPMQSNLTHQRRPVLSVNLLHVSNPSDAPDSGERTLRAQPEKTAGFEHEDMEVLGGKINVQRKRSAKGGQRVSFNKIQSPRSPTSPMTQESTSALKKLQKQKQQYQKDGTHTGFRFNCSHELLAFNQAQVASIAANPIKDQQKTSAPQLDDKLMKIQKLKDKALLIQFSRDVNKPNVFLEQTMNKKAMNQSQITQRNGLSNLLTPTSQEIIPTREQLTYAQNLVKRKHQKETQMMIDTRERFTKRFQFEKVSHQILEGTPTQTQISGSAHNELASYDSRTIFRQPHYQQPSETRVPKTYANLMRTESQSLPKLTRNYSAANKRMGTFAFAAEEIVGGVLTTETATGAAESNLRSHRQFKRTQRPISSNVAMRRFESNQASQFWKTTKRDDGSSVVLPNKQSQHDIKWSGQQTSAGTEKYKGHTGAAGAPSFDNIMLSKDDE